MNLGRRTVYPELDDVYSNIRQSAVWVTARAVFDGRIKNITLDFRTCKIILMNCLIVGIKVYLCIIEFFACKYFLHDTDKVAEHTTSESFLADIY